MTSPIKLRQGSYPHLLKVVLAIAVLATASCDQKPKGLSEAAAPEEKTVTAAANEGPAKNSGPSSPAPIAVATPPVSAAGPATHYLIKRVSVTTDSGIRSIPLGTPVQVVAQTNLDYKIRLADGTRLTVTPDQITTDANLAKQIVGSATAADAARADAARAQAEADAARRRAQTTTNAAPQAIAPTGTVAAVPPKSTSSTPVPATPAPAWKPSATTLGQVAPSSGSSLDQKAQPVNVTVTPMKKKK